MTDDGRLAVKRALISVYNKTGLVELGRGLHEAGVEIVSTGSTAAQLRDAGVPVTPVDQVTGFPEVLGGRVKTLHPGVHAGLLANQHDPAHLETLRALGIAPFQLFVGNLYPFAETVASGAGADECIEQIDIGGPTMVRASAKSHGSVAVVTNPALYDEVLEAVSAGGFTLEQRKRYGMHAFRHTASYDIAVATWMAQALVPDDFVEDFPSWVAMEFSLDEVLRYGENPHQRAAKYVTPGSSAGIANAIQLNGKPMSYNNYQDATAAWRAVYDLAELCVAIIKHSNTCGIAVGEDVAEAHFKANACDPISAFGGVIAANWPVSVKMANQLVADGMFTEVLVAPGYETGALEILAEKPNLRVLQVTASPSTDLEYRQIDGGLLVQTVDKLDQPGDDPGEWTLVAGEPVDEATLADLELAWRAVRSVKSNAILAAHDGASVGVGMGQVNRVDSCHLVVQRGGDRVQGSVAASDAFFPFPDGPEALINAGIRAIVQPGGSKEDEKTIKLCEQHGVALYFTGVRHFAH
jgi:phosphoribosylaminoimidazolecarboxamide formyltransferase/IMP cyclohydrolase